MQNIICFTALSHFSPQKNVQIFIAHRCCLQLAHIKYVKGIINDGPRNQQATAVFQTYVEEKTIYYGVCSPKTKLSNHCDWIVHLIPVQ